MSDKNLDRKGRWRTKIISFRVSPEENKYLNDLVSLSGLTKQDYIIDRILEKPLVVYGNPRVFKRIKRLVIQLLDKLKKSCDKGSLTPEEFEIIKDLCAIYYRLLNNDEIHRIDSS